MAARKTPPQKRWQERMARAGNPAEQMEAAWDHLLTSLAHLRRRQRDAVAMRQCAELAESLASEAAAGLTHLAQRADAWEPERVVERERRVI